jgi:DNA modification methylase
VIPAFQTGHVTVYQGDALAVLRELPSDSVDCCVTSPPYWGLRDYGTATWDGGEVACIHDVSGPNGRGKNLAETHWKPKERGGRCAKCGAVRIDSQIGLERTPRAFVAVMVEIFREVRRVLAPHGTLWLNLGDSYAGSWGAQGRSGSMAERSVVQARSINAHPKNVSRTGSIDPESGLKPKDMVGIPWRVAFALQEDGWYLRSDIIWAKPNPMPESVTDRPTKAHEYVFLMSKSERYYYDADAIAEPVSESTHARVSQNVAAQIGSWRANGGSKTNGPMKAVVRGKTVAPGLGIKNNASMAGALSLSVDRRNARTVWTIATTPYKGAHFATFPYELPERCIKAGCPERGTVLDPFAGSGTTLAVARDLGRKSIGIELNPEYVKLIERRCAQEALRFAVGE